MAENKGPFYARGTYKCRMTDKYGFGKTPSGTAFFEGAFKVVATVDPVNKSEKEVERSYERKFTIYLTEKTKDFATDQLKAIGWDGTALSRLDRNKTGYQDLEGVEFLGYVKHEARRNDASKTDEVWNISTGEPKGGKGPKVANEEGVAEELDDLFFGSSKVATAPVSVANEPVDPDSLPF